jgi:hypothetical protein
MQTKLLFLCLWYSLSTVLVDCLPAKPKGVDFWQDFPKIVPVQATPTQTLNLTLDEFKVLAEQNRVTHNSILPSAKTNFTLFPWNTLLFGNVSLPKDDDTYNFFGENTWPQYIKGEFMSTSFCYYELNPRRPLSLVLTT